MENKAPRPVWLDYMLTRFEQMTGREQTEARNELAALLREADLMPDPPPATWPQTPAQYEARIKSLLSAIHEMGARAQKHGLDIYNMSARAHNEDVYLKRRGAELCRCGLLCRYDGKAGSCGEMPGHCIRHGPTNVNSTTSASAE